MAAPRSRYAQGMNGLPEMVTVYRSQDMDARDDVRRVSELLADADIASVILGDDARGVVSGTYEVRVAAPDASRAEALLADLPLDESALDPQMTPADPSHALDQETVGTYQGTSAEVEALSVQALLESNGLMASIIGSSQLPNLRFEVRVPHERAVEARRLIAEAEAAGPAAAEEAERLTEGDPNTPVNP